MTMKNPTVIFAAPRQVEIRDEPMPEVGEGKALIETELTLISTGTELSVLTGDAPADSLWGRATKFPKTSGYSNVGRVLAVGAGVDKGLVGQRVQSYGGHGKFVEVRADVVRPVPAEIPADQAVFATMAEIAFHGVRRAGVGMGTCCAVCGLGLLGQISVRFARLCGARPVLGVDISETRLALLPDDRAVVRVNPNSCNAVDRIKEVNRGRRADVVIELTGVASLIPREIEMLRREGTLAVVSGPRGKTEMDFHDLCNSPSVKIVGVHNGTHPAHPTAADPWTKSRDVELFCDLVLDGEMDMTPLITHRRSFREAPEMYSMLLADRGQAMGVLLDWTT